MDPTEPPDPATPRAAVDDRVMLAAIAGELFTAENAGPVTVGRFVIHGKIGSGGMGSVFRARDPQLDRDVALKVLRRDAASTPEARARLQREAVALARLNHPNVVTVHEVGTMGGELFIAMELVEGSHLGAWAEHHPVGPRPRFERALKLLLRAGRGLEAAHTAGLVHRDFKPSNVLVGADGRVRVADFGLVDAGTEASAGRGTPQRAEAATADGLTQTGAAVGTPRYMSPEQQRGANVDARTDQFSYCVTAWKVLLGAHPWDGPFPLPESAPPFVPDGAPGWVIDVLRRGLQADASRRYDSMSDLLRALGNDPRRRRRLLLGAGSVVLVGAAAAAAYTHHRATLCDDGPAEISRIYNDDVRAQLQAHFESERPGDFRHAWDLTDGHLTGFTQRWRSDFERTCDAGRRRGVLTDAELAAGLGCLAMNLSAFRAALDVLQESQGRSIYRGPEIARRPSAGRRCDTPLPSDALPAAEREATQGLRALRDLKAAWFFRSTGREAEAVARFERATEISAGPRLAEFSLRATLFEIETLTRTGRLADAIELATPAYYAAVEQGNNHAAIALASLIADTKLRQGKLDVAAVWHEHAAAHTDRSGVGPLQRASLLRQAGSLALARGDLKAAEAASKKAIELAEPIVGEGDPALLTHLNTLAIVKVRNGDVEAAEALALKVHEGIVNAYGPRSPRAGTSLGNLVGMASAAGRHAEAVRRGEEFVTFTREQWPTDHPQVAFALVQLGTARGRGGDVARAIEAMQNADAMLERLDLGASGDALSNRRNLASFLSLLERHEEAVVLGNALVETAASSSGREHPKTADALLTLGASQTALGRLEDATESLTRAKAIFAQHADEHRDSAQIATVHLARVAENRGGLDQALSMLQPVIDEPASDTALAWALRRRAHLYEQQGRHAEALRDADRSIALSSGPSNVTPLRALKSRVLLSLGRHSDALAEAKGGLREATQAGHTPMIAELKRAVAAATPP